MSNTSSHPSRFPRLWKPALATGGGGAAILIWFEEVIALAAEFIGVILLTILGGLICLLNHFIFKSRVPRREDMQNKSNKGAKH